METSALATTTGLLRDSLLTPRGARASAMAICTTTSITGIFAAIYKIPYVLTIFFAPVSQAIYPFISKEFTNGNKTTRFKRKYDYIKINL